MSLSFREKSLWLMLASLVAVFGFYFSRALPADGANVGPQQTSLFIVAVVALVVVQVIGHAAIAIADRRTESDERDALIELKGTRNGYFVLATGVFASLCAALVTNGNFVFMHVLLAFWVLAEIVSIASQLFLYRRGA